MARIAMLIDLSKCTACRACQVACKEWNELPAEPTRNRGTYENPPDLSARTWTRIRFQEDVGPADHVEWRFFKEQCLHCAQAPCVDVCPTAALKQNPLGFVSYEEYLCNGCAYCTQFCPFGIPRMNTASKLTGRATATKCTLCQDRVTNGYVPACAKACPAGAINFGDREAMIANGKARVAQLSAGGNRQFPDASLYGADVLGGLGVMYVLPDKPEKYDLPVNPQSALTLTAAWQEILQPLGGLAIGVGVVGAAFNWVVTRRELNTPSTGSGQEKEAEHGD
jgi:formate dehydrogenase iron-sulfur subunit